MYFNLPKHSVLIQNLRFQLKTHTHDFVKHKLLIIKAV